MNIFKPLALVSMLAMSPTIANAQDLTIAGSGGGLADVLNEVFDAPFQKETGIAVNAVASTDRVSALRAMMQAGKPIWDVSELNGGEFGRAVQEGWLEKIDWARMDPDGRIDQTARSEYAVPYASFSVVLAVRNDKLPDGKTMTSWADFWDTKTFPGPRGLANGPSHNLEFALLADGVAKNDVYTMLSTEEGVDRAFAKLDEIKDDVVLWWKAGAQPIQALTDGEVFYTSGFNGRFTKLNDEGTPTTIVWNGGALKLAYFGILKGGSKIDEAYKYLGFMISSPERAAKFASKIPYPPLVRGLYDHFPRDRAATMPTFPANAEAQFTYDAAFWVANQDALSERWEEWLLQ